MSATFDEFYGLRITRCDEDGIAGELAVASHHLQPTGVVHGGVYASIAEALASYGTNWQVGQHGQVALGMTNTTSFLRPVTAGRVHAEGAPCHRGRSTQVWDVRLSDDAGHVCAVSRVTLAVRDCPPGADPERVRAAGAAIGIVA